MIPRVALLCVLVVGGCQSCGYTSVDNKMTGQVKKVHHNTPIICPDYASADVSLGVMQNGVGSVSHEDVRMTVEGKELIDVFEAAATTGRLVDVTFKERRATLCIDNYVVTEAALLEEAKKEVVDAGDKSVTAALHPTKNAPSWLHEARVLERVVNGHKITATIVGDEYTNVQIDGEGVKLDGPVGKAAIKVLEEKD